jgi:hypothetical protein
MTDTLPTALDHALALGEEVRGRWLRLTPDRPSVALSLNFEAAFAVRDLLRLDGFAVWAALVEADARDAETLPASVCRCIVIADDLHAEPAQRLLRLMRGRCVSLDACTPAELGADEAVSLVEAANIYREFMVRPWAAEAAPAVGAPAALAPARERPAPRGVAEISPRAHASAQISKRRKR